MTKLYDIEDMVEIIEEEPQQEQKVEVKVGRIAKPPKGKKIVKLNKYCVECGKKLIPFKSSNDWQDRKLHKSCWYLRKKNQDICSSINIKSKEYDKYDTDTGLKMIEVKN